MNEKQNQHKQKKENLCLKIPLFEEASHAKREEMKSGKQRM